MASTEKVEAVDKRGAIVVQVFRGGGQAVYVRRQSERLPILVEMAEVVIKRPVLLEHEDDVIDGGNVGSGGHHGDVNAPTKRVAPIISRIDGHGMGSRIERQQELNVWARAMKNDGP